MIAVIEYDYGKMCDILLLDNQLAKFVIEHEKDMLHVKQRTTIIVHTRSAMTIQHCINPPNFTKQALLFINGAQIIGIHYAGHHNHRTTLEGAPVGLLLPCTRTVQLAAHEVGLIPKY
jgi:hypothetical protein